MEKGGQADRIAPYMPDYAARYLVDIFWQIKSMTGGVDEPISPALLTGYINDQGILLNRHERDIIYQTDATLRQALAKQRADNDRYMTQKGSKK